MSDVRCDISTTLHSPTQLEQNDPFILETETDGKSCALFQIETDIDEISPNEFDVTTEEDTVSPNHVTPHSLTYSSDVHTSQDQNTDTMTSQDENPTGQQGLPITQSDTLTLLGVSSADMAHLQLSDDTFKDIYMYLHDGTLPDMQKEARKIILQSSDYLLIDNLLFHSRVAKAKRTTDMNPL
jgi:hypothetical protein